MTFKTMLKVHLIFIIVYIMLLSIETNPALALYHEKKFITRNIKSAPVQKGISLTVPKNLKNQNLASIGLVDVTSSPFNADPSGIKDSTVQIQQAINFARDNQMVTFFPTGNYLISDTLDCIQDYKDVGKKSVIHARKYPCVLLGSRLGKRPKIILAPNSLGYESDKSLKYVVHFRALLNKGFGKDPLQPNLSMNQMFINIDITVGPGNPGAVGIRHRCAEGSGVQESNIDVTYGHTGLEGGGGSGGSHSAITITGGKIGLNLRETQPAPTITGITLINQTETAILYGGRQGLSAVGIKIISNGTGPIIRGQPITKKPHHGQISLIDCEIIAHNPKAIAIESKSNLYLKNVFICGVKTAVSHGRSISIPGDPDGWIKIKEYAHGIDPKFWFNTQFKSPVYINGQRSEKAVIDIKHGNVPPSNLQSRHLWDINKFPDFESKDTINVKNSPYNAKGDGIADDSHAIQKAIDNNQKVFLPKGYYRLTKTIHLRSDTQLIGIGRHLSVLIVTEASGDFASPLSPNPLLLSTDSKAANTILSFFEVFVPRNNTAAYGLHWRSGGKSIVRDLNFRYSHLKGRKDKKYLKMYPLVLISGHGGGKWYNFNHGSRSNHGKGYRHLMIKQISGPLSFYQISAQHSSSIANIEINNSKHVSIYGQKGEENSYQLLVKNSDHILLFSYGGSAAAKGYDSLFRFINTPNFLISNCVDSPASFKKKSGREKIWYMISDLFNGVERKTLSLDRPVLYRRGNPIRFSNDIF